MCVMKTGILVALFGIFVSSHVTQAAELAVIPMPLEVTTTEDVFVLDQGAFVHTSMSVQKETIAALSKAAGFELALAPMDVACAIQFLSNDPIPGDLPKPEGEGYMIRIRPKTLIVHAATPEGHFYGLQTLIQMLEDAGSKEGSLSLPCGIIRDQPRFGWRGFMLDESREFTGEAGVKKLLDEMARFKLNRFHWHLTDSAGWRIEIKSYPKLTEIGSRGSESDRRPDAPRQFYTQDQIRSIVDYAKARHITIIPEIDMPGHADAAVLAYPELGGGGYLKKGSTDKWPNFTFNPAKPATLEFLDKVLGEIAELFPDAGIIHFGGDEVHFGWKKWNELPDVKALMEKEGFTTLAEVEAWFNRRMASRIRDLGFTVGGWDEIAARELPTDQTLIFWWRHDKPNVLSSSLANGYPVVLCPRRPLYFDFVQHESHQSGRRWGGFNPLEDVYQFPDSNIDPTLVVNPRIVGIQACLWTETTVTQERRDFMTFPRLLALSEAAWTNRGKKDMASFKTRLQQELPRLTARGIRFYDPFENSPEVTR